MSDETISPTTANIAVEIDPLQLCREIPEECAQRTLTTFQKIVLIGAVVVLAETALFFPLAVLLWLNVVFTIFYVAVSVYRVVLIDFSLAHASEVHVSKEALGSLSDDGLPE